MSSGTAGAEGAVFEPPFSIPESWAWCRLGDVCEIVLGGTPDTKKTQYWDGDIPWLTPGEMSELKDKYVSSTRRTLSQLGLEKGSRLFPSRSVILSTRAPIGYLFINSVPMSTNQGCKTLVPCRGLLPEYLYYNLLGRVDELKNLGTGTTFKELSSSALSSLCISIPPLAEQIRIVSFFEEISSLCEFIDNGEALFDLLARTAKKRILDLAIRGALVPQDPTDKPASVLLDRIRSTADKPPCPKKGGKAEPIGISDPLFPIPESWEWTTLGEIGEVVRGTGIKRSEISATGRPCVRYGEIYTTYFLKTEKVVSCIPEELFRSSKHVQARSVLMTLTGEDRKDIAKTIAYLGDEPIAISGDMLGICPREVEPLYLSFVLNSPWAIERKGKLATGDLVIHISQKSMSCFPVPLPPLAEQRRIVAKVEELFSVIDAMATK